MRFARLFLPFLICLALTSCAAEPEPPVSPLAAHTGNYEASVVIRLGELRTEAVIAQSSPDRCDVSFSAPESLAGMAFSFRPDWVTVRYGGLEFPIDAISVPARAIAEAMRGTLSMAMRHDSVEIEDNGSGIELTGTVGAGGFALSLTPDGAPLKLLIPGEELAIEFTDFTFLD